MILGLIPARGGSKGVPRKNARLLCGKPLVQWAIECAHAVPEIGRVVVSTDDAEIARISGYAGAEVLTRPSELSRDDTPMRDVVAHALERYSDAVMVALLQPTSPLRRPEHVRVGLAALPGRIEADAVASVVPVPQRYAPEWALRVRGGLLEIPPDMPTRRQALSRRYMRDGTLYAVYADSFRETGSLYGRRCVGLALEPQESLSIDTEEDWRLAEKLMEARCAVDA